MARFAPAQNSFVAGELSPGLDARDDIAQYAEGCRKLRNLIVNPQGGVSRRPGTHFVSEVEDSADNIRLFGFRVSTNLAYVIEASDLLFRYYTNEGLLISGTPVNDATVYAHTELGDIQVAQSANVMYLVHPDHYTATLRRTTATNFDFAEHSFQHGKMPMYPTNLDTNFTITVTGTGPYTLTASSDLFTDTATDAGRVVRVKETAEGWFEITAVSSATVATASLVGGVAPGMSATSNWSRGAQSDTQGFRAIAFHENRLWLLGAAEEPEGIWGSDSGIFNRFTEGGQDNEAIFLRATGSEANTVQWAASAREALFIGTGGNEGKVISTDDTILTNSSARWVPVSSVGSIHSQAIVVNGDILFIQRDAARIRRMRSTIEEDNVPEDINILHDRIGRPGFRHLIYQQSPDSVLWVTRNDGTIAGVTLEKQQQVVAWHRHLVGGEAKVTSAAVIPNPAGTEDQLWLCAQRSINSSGVQYVEFIEDKFLPVFELDENEEPTFESLALALEGAWFLDSALERNNPLTITDISKASTAVVTSAGHGLSNGARVRITEVDGLTDADGNSLVNFREFIVANATMNTFELNETGTGVGYDTSGAAVDYIGNGVVREMTQTVTGLSHLEGETVVALVDGAFHEDMTVVSGQVTLDYPGARVLVGLPYMSLAELMRMVGGGTHGTDASRIARVPRVGCRVENSVDCEFAVGPVQQGRWQKLSFRDNVDWLMSTPPPLFSGDKEEAIDGGWERGRTIRFRTNSPYPLTMLAVYPHGESHGR